MQSTLASLSTDSSTQHSQKIRRTQPKNSRVTQLRSVDSLFQRGKELQQAEQYGEAVNVFEEALEIYETLSESFSSARAKTLNALGTVFRDMKKFPEARKSLLEALDIFKKYPEEKRSLANTFFELGILFGKMGDFQPAIDYFNESLKINVNLDGNNFTSIAHNYFNLGRVFSSIGQH